MKARTAVMRGDSRVGAGTGGRNRNDSWVAEKKGSELDCSEQIVTVGIVVGKGVITGCGTEVS